MDDPTSEKMSRPSSRRSHGAPVPTPVPSLQTDSSTMAQGGSVGTVSSMTAQASMPPATTTPAPVETNNARANSRSVPPPAISQEPPSHQQMLNPPAVTLAPAPEPSQSAARYAGLGLVGADIAGADTGGIEVSCSWDRPVRRIRH